MQPSIRRRLIVVAAVVLVAAGAVVLAVALAGDTQTAPRVSPLPTTTLPPEQAPVEPVNIMLAGDSIMVGLAPALAAALDVDEVDEVRFVLTPTVLRDPSVRFAWQQELAELSPEVVIMLVSIWEGSDDDRDLAASEDPEVARQWQANYADEVLRPWVAEVAAEGASVLWLAPPPVEDPDLMEFFDSLATSIQWAASQSLDMAYVPSEVLGTGSEDVTEEIALDNGEALRVRHVDGLHLCPIGAVLLGEQVLDWISNELEISTAPGWQTGPWAQDTELYPDHACG